MADEAFRKAIIRSGTNPHSPNDAYLGKFANRHEMHLQ
jgi:hypothetical protein